MNDQTKTIKDDEGTPYLFSYVKLEFPESEKEESQKFEQYTSKTLGQILRAPNGFSGRYRNVKEELEQADSPAYKYFLNEKLGTYLSDLKLRNREDLVKRLFLNPYGHKEFIRFKIADDSKFLNKVGIYAFFVDLRDTPNYIGRCVSGRSGTYNIKKRINNGYGYISPVNVLKHGRSTNCHLNSSIAEIKSAGGNISLWVCELQNKSIAEIEADLIKANNPPWNAQLTRKLGSSIRRLDLPED